MNVPRIQLQDMYYMKTTFCRPDLGNRGHVEEEKNTKKHTHKDCSSLVLILSTLQIAA